jgi:hypothetical protein
MSLTLSLKKETPMSNVSTTRKDAGHEMEKARDAAAGAGEKMKEGAAGVVDKVKDAATHAGQAVGNVASNVGQRAESAVGSVGHGMAALGEKVQERGPDSGVLGKASHAVGDALERGGRYLEEKRISGIAGDLTDLIKRNPIPALLVGIGLGFLLARTLRS